MCDISVVITWPRCKGNSPCMSSTGGGEVPCMSSCLTERLATSWSVTIVV
jgi:hypothetical protein